MKLFIPTIGTLLRLEQPWSFELFMEYRNTTLHEHFGLPFSEQWREARIDPEDWSKGLKHTVVTIPAQAELRVDRIYIRKGAEDFDSLTFYWKGAKTDRRTAVRKGTIIQPGSRRSFEYDVHIPRKPVRFWAKLEDVNGMEVTVVTEGKGPGVLLVP